MDDEGDYLMQINKKSDKQGPSPQKKHFQVSFASRVEEERKKGTAIKESHSYRNVFKNSFDDAENQHMTKTSSQDHLAQKHSFDAYNEGSNSLLQIKTGKQNYFTQHNSPLISPLKGMAGSNGSS